MERVTRQVGGMRLQSVEILNNKTGDVMGDVSNAVSHESSLHIGMRKPILGRGIITAPMRNKRYGVYREEIARRAEGNMRNPGNQVKHDNPGHADKKNEVTVEERKKQVQERERIRAQNLAKRLAESSIPKYMVGPGGSF